MPALLTSASIDLKRDIAVATILAAVAGSPMFPSTKATWSEAATSVDLLMLRELATTLKPRSTNAFTIPAPIPCEAPVTMAVFDWLFMVCSPKGLGADIMVECYGLERRNRVDALSTHLQRCGSRVPRPSRVPEAPFGKHRFRKLPARNHSCRIRQQ